MKGKPVPTSQYESVSVEKIKNGYLCRKSTETKSGYKSETIYYPSKPKLVVPDSKGGKKK